MFTAVFLELAIVLGTYQTLIKNLLNTEIIFGLR